MLYFTEGSRLSSPEVWTPLQDLPLYEWAWEKMVIKIAIINWSQTRLQVLKEGQGT